MKHRYFSVIILASVAFIISLGLILVTMYNYFSEVQWKQLRRATEISAMAVINQGEDFRWNLPDEQYRTTLISPQGEVIFDTEKRDSHLENHLKRKEVQEAMESGYGESQRYSDTMMTKMYYVAKKLPDGTILRLSMKQYTLLRVLWQLSLPISLIMLFVISMAVAISYRESQKDTQAETEAMRREFTANVSHELKSPLHVVSGFAELMKSGMARPEDMPGFAEKIYNEAQRMIRLVEDIITLSKLDEGQASDKKVKVNLYKMLQCIVEELQPKAKEKDISFELIGEQCTTFGIAQLLHQLFYNLCENAIKYNRQGSSVTIAVHWEDGHPQVSVRDTGIGIPQEDIGRIFERFYRVDKSHSKEVGGTGLGLSIVKHAAKINGAKIEVESLMNEGTIFTVKF